MKEEEFIEVPFVTYDVKAVELTGKDVSDVEQNIQKRKFRVSEIEYYEEAMPQDKDFAKENVTCVDVFMKSGNNFLVNMNFKEFEKLLFSK